MAVLLPHHVRPSFDQELKELDQVHKTGLSACSASLSPNRAGVAAPRAGTRFDGMERDGQPGASFDPEAKPRPPPTFV